MDTIQVNDSYTFHYDPWLYGFDTTFLRVIAGGTTPTMDSGRLSITNSNMSSLRSFMMGNFEFSVVVPHAPTSGDSTIFGLYQKSYGNRNAAYFFISGSNFYARSYGDDGVSYDQTTITWDDAWTAATAVFEIRWFIDAVEFWTGTGTSKRRLARHVDYVPKQVMLPVYFSSASLLVNYFAGNNIRKSFVAVTASAYVSPSASISPSVSPSVSPSTSISPSISPSVSPSTSISPSVSPSVSISISPSVSKSISTSISPSVSPSTSISPSSSPSVSPSTSISPSVSPSISPSVSNSTSPSVSPSTSISPSVSSSISPSVSKSISPSISSSVSPSASPSISPSVSPSQTMG